MPSAEELEQMLDEYGERSLAEFPDDDAWEKLKTEVMSSYTPEDDDHGDR